MIDASEGDLPEELQDLIRKADQSGEEIISHFANELNAQKPPTIVYHYTNEVGLKGILETGKLWLTDVFDLNDPSEITHGISFAVNHLKTKAAGGARPVTFFTDVFARFPEGGIREAAHYFTASLSSDGDELGQWRAYGDNGRGYAIGFDAEALAKVLRNDREFAVASVPVTYNDHQLARIQTALVDSAYPFLSHPALNGMPIATQVKYYTTLGTSLSLNVLGVALYFKNEAYKREVEYRLLKMRTAEEPPPGMKLRRRGFSTGKYVELDWRTDGRSALKAIVIGPAADQERAREFARESLEQIRSSQVDIVHSKIPYRAG